MEADGTVWTAAYPSFRNPLAVARYRNGKWTMYSSAKGLLRAVAKWDPDIMDMEAMTKASRMVSFL